MENICTKLGINYKSVKLIIKHKLIMDKRRGEGDKNQLFNSLVIYFILGLFSMPIVGMNANPMIKMSLFFSIFMVMILNVFITDFSNVILDIDDKEILLTKGVDSKTLNVAKFIHIIIYIGLISFSMSAGSIIISFKYGIGFTLTLIVNILLIDILTLIISAIIYTVILKLFSGEKLKDMINGFQIAFLLLFVIGFQFVGRAFDISNLELIYNSKRWNILVPPMWFAANFNIISGENTDNIIKLMSLLSISLPVISLIIYLKMIPVFECNLQKLNDNSYKKSKLNKKGYHKISSIICKDNNEERIFFNFIYEILNKDRNFKAKVYPSLAMGVFMPLLMIITNYNNEGLINYIKNISGSDYYFSVYLCVILTQNAITLIKYSKEYKGSWIYDILPIKNENNIYSAMFKVTTYKLMLPVFILMSTLFLTIFKLDVIPHITIVFAINIIVSLYTFKIDNKDLPFTLEYKNNNASSNIITMLKSILVIGIFALIHYIIRNNIFFKLIYLVLLIITIKFLYKRILR